MNTTARAGAAAQADTARAFEQENTMGILALADTLGAWAAAALLALSLVGALALSLLLLLDVDRRIGDGRAHPGGRRAP